MKKLFSVLLVLALLFSMSVTAFAAGTDEVGSITITNATVGQTYAPYKIFDATITTGTTTGISYSITEDNQFFDDLFNNPLYITETDPHYNPFFVYNPNTGSVTKRDGVNDTELVAHLKALIYDENDAIRTGLTAAAEAVVADSETVLFEDLPYGYYLITSTLGTTVTINSTNPDAVVIDKNQEPASDFNKQIQVGVDDEGNPLWDEANTAEIGDQVNYKISFTATNYDGDKLIQYYQVHDVKGDSIWAEFDSIKVFVDGVELTKGYYLAQGGANTDGWGALGDWTGVDEANRTPANADWYLVHLDYDRFRITIPWLQDHTLNANSVDGQIASYTLSFPDEPASKYDSPASVVITYSAAVEPNAAIGPLPQIENRYNKAHASWTSEHETLSTPDDEVKTYVYGLGLLKDDGATHQNLAGAKFRLYRDADCTDPVYVIPTDIDGVYIVDSLNAYIDDVSGSEKATSRTLYGHNVAEYLSDEDGNPLTDENGVPLTQDNRVVSQVNGKLVVLGLEQASYYLVEVEAPAGYNALTTPIEMKVGEGTSAFYVFANANGDVADIQATDGIYLNNEFQLTHTVVHNSTGTVLPSTGGTGTMWFIAIGAAVALAFAVLLITNKKMTAYRD